MPIKKKNILEEMGVTNTRQQTFNLQTPLMQKIQNQPQPQLKSVMPTEIKKPLDNPLDYKHKETIDFNPDKTINYGVSGQQFKLTKEDYSSLLGEGAPTETADKLREAIIASKERASFASAAKGNQAKENFINEAINYEIGQAPPMAAPEEQTAKREELKTKYKENMGGVKKLDKLGSYVTELLSPARIAGNVLDIAAQSEYGKALFSETAKLISAFGSIPVLKYVSPSKYNTDAINIQSNMQESLKIINSQISNVAQGLQSPSEVLDNINAYEIQLSRLEESNKGLGLANLDYWVTRGVNMDEDINAKKEKIVTMKADLLGAIQKQNMQQQNMQRQEARGRLGL